MPAYTPADSRFEARIRASFARQGAMALIGARLGRVEPGLVEIELPFRAELTQQHGYFHAGMTSAIADTAGGYAGYTLFPADSTVLTVEYKINLLAPADGDLLIATGRVRKSGRTLTICDLEVLVRKGATTSTCAAGLQTLICLQGKSDSPPP
jgi:uncharacterized protein (TIGR00369 family)